MGKSYKELNDLYSNAEKSLNGHFAEIRTNILLDIGIHHPRTDRMTNLRTTIYRDSPNQKQIKITKNHIQNITKFIRNTIANRAPDAGVFPKNKKELADQKSAELNQSVYDWLRNKHQLQSFYSKMIHDFVVCGECWVKVFHDPEGGEFSHFEPDDEGELQAVFKPSLIYERIPPYNLLTDPDADGWETCSWVCIRKNLAIRKLEDKYGGDEEKWQVIKRSSDANDTEWFDGFTGMYHKTGDYVQIREYYFKPCREYPLGFYYIGTDHGILEKGDLPDGFCIFRSLYDESPQNPRAYSVIRTIKPYQIEINRCAAATITESLVLGHSTVVYQAGSKLSTSSVGNGLKGLSYASANAPTIIPGRSGEQYTEYQAAQIEEMYRVAQVPMQDEDKTTTGMNDAMAMLFRSIRDKMKFSIYGEKIELMIMEIVEYSLKLCRRYLPDSEVIPIVGKSEAVNIPEFKKTLNNNYMIKIEPRTDDFTSTMGRSLQLSQVMQYVGGQLPPEAIAHIVRQYPFINDEEMFKDLTTKQDTADAMILSLDRGELPFFYARCDHAYMADRLQTRMNSADFPLLSQDIQMNYNTRLTAHEAYLQQEQQDAAQATSGFIPSGGGMITADYYVTSADGKQQRARIPYEAMDWLVKKLATQGTSVEKISNMPVATQADIGKMNQAQQQQAPEQPPQMSPQSSGVSYG
jgi:hypothetical protein